MGDAGKENYSKMPNCKCDRKKTLLGYRSRGFPGFVLVIMPWQKADTAWLSDQLGWAAAKNSIYSLHVN